MTKKSNKAAIEFDFKGIYGYRNVIDYIGYPSFKILYKSKEFASDVEEEEIFKAYLFDFLIDGLGGLKKEGTSIDDVINPIFSPDIKKCAEKKEGCAMVKNAVIKDINLNRCKNIKCAISEGETIKKCIEKRCVKSDNIQKEIERRICINNKCLILRNAVYNFMGKNGRTIDSRIALAGSGDRYDKVNELHSFYKIKLSSNLVLELEEYKPVRLKEAYQKGGIIYFFDDGDLNEALDKSKLNPDNISIFVLRQIEFGGDELFKKMFERLEKNINYGELIRLIKEGKK